MAAIGDALRRDLQQPEFSEGYAESFLDTFIATQLKVLREQNEWTQAQLAEKMGKKQTVISRSENINYSSWNISTLKEYARAFRLRLKVSFETYGSLIDDVENFSKEKLGRDPRESDPDLGNATPKAVDQMQEVALAARKVLVNIGQYKERKQGEQQKMSAKAALPDGNTLLNGIRDTAYDRVRSCEEPKSGMECGVARAQPRSQDARQSASEQLA